MRNNRNTLAWLKQFHENEMAPSAGDPAGFGPPMSPPGFPSDPMGIGQQGQDQAEMPQLPPEEEDLSQDPAAPEMPQEEEDIYDDFEVWRKKYVDESIKGDPYKLSELIQGMRDKVVEDPSPRKFVEDNLQICNIRKNVGFYPISVKIRRALKQDIDRNLPSTSVMRHVTTALEEVPIINDCFIKMLGNMGGKQDLHRKFIAGLLGAVQVGSGGSNEDLIFQESDWSIKISTRFNTKWGDVDLGSWDLIEGDPERFLKEVELDRLEAGSPEERDVLRRRVVIEAIANKYKHRAFFITVVDTNGTIQHLGMDLGNCLQAGFLEGRLVVRSEDSDARQIFIDDDGNVVAIPDLTIYYVKEVKGLRNRGTEEIEFIRHRNGTLFLSALPDLLEEAASTLQGIVLKEIPWNGNPTDFLRLSRTAPGADEMLFRSAQ